MHDREYHHAVWQFLVGNSDVLLLIATLGAALVTTSAAEPDGSPGPSALGRRRARPISRPI
jgi:hypothetical protein